MDLMNRTIPVEAQKEFIYFINEIMKSGVLLDEDIESVLDFYGIYVEKSDNLGARCVTWRDFVMSGVALGTALISVQKRLPVTWVVLSLTPAFYTGGLVLKRVHNLMKRNKRRGNLKAIIQAFKDIPKLNREILQYLKLKNGAKANETEGIYTGFNVIIQNAMDQLFNGHVNLLNSLKQWIIYFSELVPILQNDYTHLINLDPNSYLNYSLESLDKYYELYQNISDVFVLFASGCLACFSLSLIPNLWLEEPNFSEVFDKVLPVMALELTKSYKAFREVFENMKYYFLKDKPKAIKLQTSLFEESSQLRQATYTSLSSVNATIARASAVFNMLENVDFDRQRNREQILDHLRELQLDLNSTNTYMGLLINVYEVNLRKRQNQLPALMPTEDAPESHVPETREESIIDYSTIDPDAAEDEEFEAVTTDSDAVPEQTASSSFTEDIDGYIARMLSRELKEALASHGRFAAARTKRGVVEESVTREKASPTPAPPVMPELNLPATSDSGQTEKPLFVPPPPLLPVSVDPPPVTTTAETEDWNFLSALQNASRNRKVTEEVFEADLEKK